MPVATVAITKPKLLLGEGKDEARFSTLCWQNRTSAPFRLSMTAARPS